MVTVNEGTTQEMDSGFYAELEGRWFTAPPNGTITFTSEVT